MAYPDTFGGSIYDPNAIHELVISCASQTWRRGSRFRKMLPWAEGKGVSFDLYDAGFMACSGSRIERIYSECYLPEADLIVPNAYAAERFSAPYIAPAV